MTITIPESSKTELIDTIQTFTDTTSAHRHPLVEWQWLLGWINWALNTYPLLKPALQSSYAKISGKLLAHASIYLNCEVIDDLQWVIEVMNETDGVCMIDTITWDHDDADLEIYCDTTQGSMGFYCPSHEASFFAALPKNALVDTIF